MVTDVTTLTSHGSNMKKQTIGVDVLISGGQTLSLYWFIIKGNNAIKD